MAISLGIYPTFSDKPIWDPKPGSRRSKRRFQGHAVTCWRRLLIGHCSPKFSVVDSPDKSNVVEKDIMTSCTVHANGAQWTRAMLATPKIPSKFGSSLCQSLDSESKGVCSRNDSSVWVDTWTRSPLSISDSVRLLSIFNETYVKDWQRFCRGTQPCLLIHSYHPSGCRCSCNVL